MVNRCGKAILACGLSMAGCVPVWAQDPAILIESRNAAGVPESVTQPQYGRSI